MTPIDYTTENPEAILYEAAHIKTEIKKLQDTYDMLEPQVIARVIELSSDKDKYALQVGEIGTFTIAKYRKWTYSAHTQQMESAVKEAKKTEEADGTATAEVKDTLRFNEMKTNDNPPQ